jgi:hypothetical protein
MKKLLLLLILGVAALLCPEAHAQTTIRATNGNFSGTVSVGGGNPWFDVTSGVFNAKCDGTTDDTTAIQAAVAAARLLGADVRFPNGKTCVMTTSSSPAINLDEAIDTSLLCGTGAGRSRPGGGTNLTCTIHFTGTPAIAVGARASFGVAINGVALLADNGFTGNIVDTSHFPGDTRCAGSPCDTENFNLQNSTIFGGSACSIGISFDKAIISAASNNHFFGCVTQIKGASGTGSYSNVIKIRDNDFNGSTGVTGFIVNPGEAWTIDGNTFEVNNAVVNTLGNSGSFTDTKGLKFSGNWDGDDAGSSAMTKYVLPASTTGAVFQGNTISATHNNVNVFSFGNNSRGIVISGNTFPSSSTFATFYTFGSNNDVDVGSNDYQTATITTFLSGTPSSGTLTTVAGDKRFFGHVTSNISTTTVPSASIQAQQSTANSTGFLPTITGAAILGDGAVDVSGAGGTGKAYGIIGTARAVNASGGEKAYGGWFKSIGFSSASEEVGTHAEVIDAGTASTIQEGYTNGVQKYRLDGDGSLYLTKLLIGAPAPTISSGFGTSPSVVSNNGPASFTINVGTGGTATNGVIGLPSATTGWNCSCEDITTTSATVNRCKQTGAGTTTTVPIGNFNTTPAAAAWVASDILTVSCLAR